MVENDSESKKKSARLRQTDVPSYSVKDALRVPQALSESYGKTPTRPLLVAKAMGMSPTSGPFRMITGASVAYELTEGGAQSAAVIALSPLGRRVVSPTLEGDDQNAIREAMMKPRIIREFLTRYDGSKLPAKNIALNVLEEMGVPASAAPRAFDMILENANFVGFLENLNGGQYVNLGSAVVARKVVDAGLIEEPSEDEFAGRLNEPVEVSAPVVEASVAAEKKIINNKRVFISHGKNRAIVDQLREVLGFGGFEPVISVDKESTATPVPDKVMDDMRSCGAGIVNVGTDQTITDSDGVEHKFLNQNVLIEIGAALALYKRNFILLVESGVELPSNLQGLYEVRYSGATLDYEATMKLLKAFNEIKTNASEDKA